jgi:TPP-dependent pyruvate/acetoin dehydrogenase alpha subunit
MELQPDRVAPLLRTMLLMRRTEEAVCEMADEFPGNFHVYIGQEATGASVISQITRDDPIFTTHRNHAHNIARGVPVEAVLAEILGRATGPSGGKGGTFHVMSTEHKTVATAIVGGSTILATGGALATQVMGDGRVSVAFLGDRTLNEGAVWEAFNLASLWSLPVLYVCENNNAEPYNPRASGLTLRELSDAPRGFGIECSSVDGTDPVATYEAVQIAVEYVRRERKPFFLEPRTPRWPGNAGADPSLSITGATDVAHAWEPPDPDPNDSWHRADPLLRLIQYGVEQGTLTRDGVQQVDQGIRDDIARAQAAARAAPFPAADQAVAGARAEGQLWPA